MDEERVVSESAYVAFLSDYGLSDEFVGVCHGVIARRCPAARVIDLTHEVPRHDVRAAALTLAAALAFLPAGVAMAVVDPEVGGPRRAVALSTREQRWHLVGPDNGLLMPAAERLGGVLEAVDIGMSTERLRPVSATFHGRDIFAPVAAALADGAALASLGTELSPAELVPLEMPQPHVSADGLEAHVLRIDSFGNLSLDARPEQLTVLGVEPGDALRVSLDGREHRARYTRTFKEVKAGALLVFEDSQGAVALAVNRGSAAAMLGARTEQELLIARDRRAPGAATR